MQPIDVNDFLVNNADFGKKYLSPEKHFDYSKFHQWLTENVPSIKIIPNGLVFVVSGYLDEEINQLTIKNSIKPHKIKISSAISTV
jgi:hypothetical protein